jgi:GAF domain-containing protein
MWHNLLIHCASGGSVMASNDPTTDHDHGADAAAISHGFAETARALFAAGDPGKTLSQLLALAVATIEGCDFAGVVVIEGDVVTTPVHTDDLVIELDALQHRFGEGPCLDAVTANIIFYAADLADDARWPAFGPAATERGVRSVLALPLFVDGPLGALNLYAYYPEAFGVIDRARGLLLAALASLAFATAQIHEEAERREENLHAALASREIIGQAQGILMERERVSADQAFDILRRASQHLNQKLREVAQTLVDTGEPPDTGPSRP